MKDLKEYIKAEWVKAYQSIEQNELEQIYVFSFFVYDNEDDPRKPTLTIGYNTFSNFEQEKTRASSDEEAKWNYAFWLQNNLILIGENDVNGGELIKNWVSDLGLQYDDHEADFDQSFKGQKITENFVALLVQIVQESHSEELTHLPILIHELEYYDIIRDQNILANGPERVREFTSWINDMYASHIKAEG